MFPVKHKLRPKDLRLIDHVIYQKPVAVFRLRKSPVRAFKCPQPCSQFSSVASRAGKTVSKKKVKDLVQGPVQGEPLPPAGPDDVRKDSMLQGVRSNMKKFPDAVLLTKVGNFYEVGRIRTEI